MKSNKKKSRGHRYITRSAIKKRKQSQVTKSSIFGGTHGSSATYDEELDKRLKSQYGIKELRVVLHDYLYDNSLPLHTRCFLTFKDVTPPLLPTEDHACLKSLPDLSADDFNFVSCGYDETAVCNWINSLQDTKECSNTLEEKKCEKLAGLEDTGIVQEVKYNTTKDSQSINRDDRLEGKTKKERKVERTTPKNKRVNSTETCQSQEIKIMSSSNSKNDRFVVKSNSSVCSNKEDSLKSQKTSYSNNVVGEDGLYTPKICRRKWNPCKIQEKIKDMSSVKEDLIVTDGQINIDNNFNINNNCDINQNRNGIESWKNIKFKSKGSLIHSLSGDEKYSDNNRRKLVSSEPLKIKRKRRRPEISKSISKSSSLQAINYNIKKILTKCNSICGNMSDVSGLTSVSALQSKHVSSVHNVDVVDIMHKPNDVPVVSPTLSKKSIKQVDTFISCENLSGSNPCTNKNVFTNPENGILKYFTSENIINGETSINKENVTHHEVTNFGFSEEAQIVEKNSEKQTNEKSNEKCAKNDVFNVEVLLGSDDNKCPDFITPEILQSNSNINHSSRNSVHLHVDSFSNDNAVVNTDVFESKQSSTNKRKLPRITEDNILPKGTLEFLLRNRETEKGTHTESSNKAKSVKDEQELSVDWNKVNNDITERYFASFKDTGNNVQSLPSLVSDEEYGKKAQNNITLHAVDDSASVMLALTADNLTKFNEATNDDKVTLNSGQIFPKTEDVAYTAKNVLFEKNSKKKQNKRRWLDNSKNSISGDTKAKKLKLNRSISRNNSIELSGLFPSPQHSGNQTTEVIGQESNKNFDNKSARSSGISEKFLEPDLALIESADTIQMCTPRKSFSETSIETQKLTEIIESWEKAQMHLGEDQSGNITADPVLENCDLSTILLAETNEKVVGEADEIVPETNKAVAETVAELDDAIQEVPKTNEKLADTNIPDETGTKGVEKSTPKISKKTNRKKELEVDENEDVINLYVDDDDLISLCNTETGNINIEPPTTANLKAVESTFGVDVMTKEKNNRKIPSESEHGSSDSSPFNINVFINQTVKDFNKVYETLESKRTERKVLRSGRRLTSPKDNNRKMVVDVKKNYPNGFDEESATAANIKKAANPSMSINCDLQKIHYQDSEPKIDLPFISVQKIFTGYCFALLKYGNCFRNDLCHFHHDIRSLVQQICHGIRDHYLVILNYLIERQYSYIAKVTYVDILQFSETDKIMEFYKKLAEGQFLNYMTVYSTLNTLLRKKMSIDAILSALISPLIPNNIKMSSIVLDVAEKHIPAGEYWKTLREIFLKIRPNASQVGKILTECVTAQKDIQHVEDVNENVLMLLSKVERAAISDRILSSFYHYVRCKRQQFNSSQAEVQNNKTVTAQNAIETIASPDPTEKAGDLLHETIKITSLNENSLRLDSEHLTNCTKAPKSAGVSDDGKSFVLHPIDNLPEPSSAHRDRFWKFHLDVDCLREGLKHFDYEYVRQILDKYADSDQRTLIARSFYNILRTEIKRSQSHLNNIIELSVQAGSLAALHAVIQAGKYVLKAFIHEALWGFAYILQKSLQPYNSQPDAEVILILAEIYIANRQCSKAFTLLKQYNIIYTNRKKWRVPSNDNDSDLRIIVISLLLEMFCKESVEHAFFLFVFLLREQTYNYSPIDLTRFVDKLMSQMLSENCIDRIKAMAALAIENNFTFKTTTFRALITYLYHHDMSLAKQMYRYGIGLGVYNAIMVSFPVIVHIKIHWTEEEIYFLLSYLFEKLVEDIGPGIDRLRPNVLRIYVIFETIPSDFRSGNTVNSEEVQRLEKFSMNTVRKILRTRFTPITTMTKKRLIRMLKLQSKSVVDYLKSIS